MKKITISIVLSMLVFSLCSQEKVTWVSTSAAAQWEVKKGLTTMPLSPGFDIEVQLDKPLQTIEGFGTCFNELGWTSLSVLSKNDRNAIFRELFAPGVGANFNICRMPVGANDFSPHWYSYNETDGDFEMKNFSIANDLKTLIPFIKSAQRQRPALKIWASPWSSPAWMKYNKHYALKSSKAGYNDLKPVQEGNEETDMFIQEDKYFKAYALYFDKFIKAYQQQDIRIHMVMPQNEFKAAQIFPSCTWTAKGLGKFIHYLAPKMAASKVAVFFGTMNSSNEKLADSILSNKQINQYIKGIGLQWAGKDAIAGIHQRYPALRIYQTEQECGDGNNNWAYCVYTWGLMKHYLSNGANAYMYWNTSLKKGGISTWGWKQNSLISVDTANKTFQYNFEYYLMKQVSHYVNAGAKRLQTSGGDANLLAFMNTDKSIVIICYNESKKDETLRIKVGNNLINPIVKAESFNTFIVEAK
ncbi:MAG: glycoside hydrolase family 30 protein [Ferruginibacter sp.]|nr:glycoside hydrolase family 30 protein [Ferruginibacter sp.]